MEPTKIGGKPIPARARSQRFACRLAHLVLAAALVAGGAPSAPALDSVGSEMSTPMLGFPDPATAAKQRLLEKTFDSFLRKENLEAWMKRMSARPHHLGSAFDKENAEFIAAQFRSWGYEVEIEEFGVLFPTPKLRLLEMISPEKFSALLEEPPVAGDVTSSNQQEQLPPYNAYSVDGDVTGQLVYVNYGVPRDYELLAERGIDVKGKIVIARYGGSWRGIKPKVAAEHGAIGCLIYSDPRDDGYFEGDVYPQGAFRNANSAQRGSVADLPLYPGDPLTPGVSATRDAERLDLKAAATLTKIPVLPISYGDALPLLRALTNGPVAPEEWRGALPLTYHLGPGPARVHLKLEFHWAQATAYDVIAKMLGSERPDEWILRGNHHDAWVFGADDPLSGTVALMEEARAFAELTKTGWKPRRTIVFAVWDGEEPGLLGSTEWVETHLSVLRKKAVVYLNGDTNGRGFLRPAGSHTLERLVNQVAMDVIDPQKQIPVAQRLRAARLVRGTPEEKKDTRARADLRIAALGSGSDYTPFLQFLGIATLDLRYGGEDGGGSYHSAYDSFDHYRRFGDPEFVYGVTLAQTAGRVLLRLANAEVLPLEFSNFSETLGKYVGELKKLADDSREKTRESNRLIAEHVLTAVSDPTQPYVQPKTEPLPPFLNFAPLDNGLVRLQGAAASYGANLEKLRNHTGALAIESRDQLNALLKNVERSMLLDAGLPRRSWYKHLLYAPGFYTGYGVKTLPGVREAIEGRNWVEAEQQITVAAEMMGRVADQIEQATDRLQQALK
jgi:N-acetylated-alpha-linked acidic dipeptidase